MAKEPCPDVPVARLWGYDADVDTYPTDHRSPWIDENGFLRVRTGSERRTRAALELDLRRAATLAEDGLLQTIWDARAAGDIDPDVWIPLIKRIASIVSELAVLVDGATTSHAVAFAGQIDALLLPCRAFSLEPEAIAWLNSIERRP